MTKMQQTLAEPVFLSGFGVHGGKPVELQISPAAVDNGIVFIRDDGEGRRQVIPALSSQLGSTMLNTSVGPADFGISTIEHLMAAVTAAGIDNLIVEINGPEVPILGGGSAEFMAAFAEAGLSEQNKARNILTVLQPVRVEDGQSWAELRPYNGTRYEVEIDFPIAAIGRQSFSFDLDRAVFTAEIARARTFGFMRDVEKLRSMGLALGSSLENSIAIGDDGQVLNPEGLYYPDEFVRHKLLDSVGDLALAGYRFRGLFRSYRGGHKLNAALVKALLEREEHFRLEVQEQSPQNPPN
ncbi:UDP-3-O-acyl-N-acetylglucosamine deacetylase [Pseudochrobactrum sp. HB0163]|uniref:UDP-3-O-acyl-N-acetylglucosamine deacetylase n=1 Tax=Pseudochrobactrum sp. HB0163 TaxID=3450708 RepID=UPI003F6E0F96